MTRPGSWAVSSGGPGMQILAWPAICSPNHRGADRRTGARQSRVEAAGRRPAPTLDSGPGTTSAGSRRSAPGFGAAGARERLGRLPGSGLAGRVGCVGRGGSPEIHHGQGRCFVGVRLRRPARRLAARALVQGQGVGVAGRLAAEQETE
jgi:hypothetical protein